ncbi:putative nucleotidyltransferase substrate binding domain-containing protein [Moraxella catarrhalis]|uniref:putative nucleotidyltransferase substrate binding domain-containing protein n=1 Tax=Moraxella catarrhalis TaxID=480 RepID=UPI001F526081|nr:putative nucleotidyltransferase substrate binding domain-containing protein [Moraxella catarrhalis]
MGIFPVVHGTRALALKAKISKTNTFERIARLSQMGLIEQQLSQDVSEALAYLMNTRLKMNFWHSSTTKSLPQTTLIPKIYPHLSEIY